MDALYAVLNCAEAVRTSIGKLVAQISMNEKFLTRNIEYISLRDLAVLASGPQNLLLRFRKWKVLS